MPDNDKEKNVIHLTPKTKRLVKRLIVSGVIVAMAVTIVKLRQSNEALLKNAHDLMDANDALFELLDAGADAAEAIV